MKYNDWLEEKFQQQLHGEWYGNIHSFFLGSGIELADPRKYQSGDAARRINRKLSAKHNNIYVNTYQEEHLPVVELCMDMNKNRLTGINQLNSSLISEFLADYALVAHKWHIRTHIHYLHEKTLHHIALDTLDARYARLSEFPQFVRTVVTPHYGYQTSLSDLFSMILAGRKAQRIVMVVSDFLTAEVQSYSLVNELHYLATIRIPTSLDIGSNYNMWEVSMLSSQSTTFCLG